MPTQESPPIFSKALGIFQSFKPLYFIHNYVDLGSYLIPAPLPSAWWPINRRKRVISLYELEVRYGKSKAHDRSLKKCFDKVDALKQTVCGEHRGLIDLIVPIQKEGQILGYLLAGAFADKEISVDSLKRRWIELTGLKANPALPEYREFVKVLLETPVLDSPLLSAYQESLELFARLLADAQDIEAITQRVTQLLSEIISKRLPHYCWMDWVLGRPTTEAVPIWSREMETWDWTRYEIGITRIPTTVLSVIPRRAGHLTMEWTEEMFRMNRFQYRSFLFAQTVPQTVGGKLENYGAVFVTSADPSKPRLVRRKQIEETAEHIRQFAVKEWGGPVLMGVGGTVAPGESLSDSYHQSLLALHLGLPSARGIAFKAPPRMNTSEGMLELNHLLHEMSNRFRTLSFSDMGLLWEEYLRKIMLLYLPNPIEVRWHLNYALLELTGVVRERIGLKEKEAGDLYSGLARQMENAGTTQEMAQIFQESLDKLMQQVESRKTAVAAKPMEVVQDYVDQHFREPLHVSKLAKVAGISISTLSRKFKESSGMGFEVYLQTRRLGEAKFLLKTGNLPVFRIGQDCGFKSKSYFVQLFKKKTGLTPEKFRRKFQNA